MTDITAFEQIDDPCPKCGVEGFNRIWQCGSLMIAGDFRQSKMCAYTESLLEAIERHEQRWHGVLHSMTMALTPGNDKVRELQLTKRIAEEAMHSKTADEPDTVRTVTVKLLRNGVVMSEITDNLLPERVNLYAKFHAPNGVGFATAWEARVNIT